MSIIGPLKDAVTLCKLPTVCFRTKKEDYARDYATERGQCWGFCVFDGWWYVGSRADLEKICVEDNVFPRPEVEATNVSGI